MGDKRALLPYALMALVVIATVALVFGAVAYIWSVGFRGFGKPIEEPYVDATPEEMRRYAASLDPAHLDLRVDARATARLALAQIDSRAQVDEDVIEWLVSVLQADWSAMYSHAEVFVSDVFSRNGHAWVRVRLVTAAPSVEFIDVRVGRARDGSLHALDLESLSMTLSLSEFIISGEAGRPFWIDLASGTRSIGDPIPEDLQGNLNVMMLRHAFEREAFPGRELVAADELRDRFPNFPAPKLEWLLAHYNAHSCVDCIATIEMLERYYPDPVWNTFRALIYEQRGDRGRAQDLYLSVAREDPILRALYPPQ